MPLHTYIVTVPNGDQYVAPGGADGILKVMEANMADLHVEDARTILADPTMWIADQEEPDQYPQYEITVGSNVGPAYAVMIARGQDGFVVNGDVAAATAVPPAEEPEPEPEQETQDENIDPPPPEEQPEPEPLADDRRDPPPDENL